MTLAFKPLADGALDPTSSISHWTEWTPHATNEIPHACRAVIAIGAGTITMQLRDVPGQTAAAAFPIAFGDGEMKAISPLLITAISGVTNVLLGY